MSDENIFDMSFLGPHVPSNNIPRIESNNIKYYEFRKNMKAPAADGKVYRWGLHITFNKTPNQTPSTIGDFYMFFYTYGYEGIPANKAPYIHTGTNKFNNGGFSRGADGQLYYNNGPGSGGNNDINRLIYHETTGNVTKTLFDIDNANCVFNGKDWWKGNNFLNFPPHHSMLTTNLYINIYSMKMDKSLPYSGCNFNYNGQSNVQLYCEQLPQISPSNTNAPINPNYRAFQIANSDGQTNVFKFYVNIQCNILNNL